MTTLRRRRTAQATTAAAWHKTLTAHDIRRKISSIAHQPNRRNTPTAQYIMHRPTTTRRKKGNPVTEKQVTGLPFSIS